MGHKVTVNKDSLASFNCLKCDFSFSSSKSRSEHMKSIHETQNQRIKCDKCDFSAKNKDILHKHMKVAMGHKIQKACRFYLEGGCNRGRFCRFLHPKKFYNEKKGYWNNANLEISVINSQIVGFPIMKFVSISKHAIEENIVVLYTCQIIFQSCLLTLGRATKYLQITKPNQLCKQTCKYCTYKVEQQTFKKKYCKHM